jgi:hypothetical protein
LAAHSWSVCVRRKLPALHPSREVGSGGNNSLHGFFHRC